jgi:KaiC/GvpD/RAD55 family RecA-like ATPase
VKLFERLLDTDVKADLLTLFHNNAHLQESPDSLAKRIGRNATEVQVELEDLVELGILKKTEVYSFGTDRDKEIQDSISAQLALAELSEPDTASMNGDSIVQIAKAPTGNEVLDKAFPKGMPTISTTLILSDPGAGKETLVTYFVGQQLQSKKSIIYVTLDNFPPNIRQTVRSQLEGSTNYFSPYPFSVYYTFLTFIDGYSKTVGVESEEPYVVDPENLSAISIALSDIMSKKAISLIVIDSFNTVIRKRGVRSALELLRVLVARTRQAKCQCFVTMNRKAFHPAIVASAQDTVDGVIELKTEEGPEGILRLLRVLKMAGTKHSTAWLPYEISDEGQLIPSGSGKTESTDDQI